MPQRAAEIAAALATWWRAGPADLDALRAAVEAMPVGIVVTESGGGQPPRLLAWNPAFTELTGWSPRGGEPLAELPYKIYRPDRVTLFPVEELPGPKAALSGAPIHHVVTHTLRPDGTWRVIAVSGSPLPSPDPARRRGVAVLLDVSASQELEDLRARTRVLAAHVRDGVFLVRRSDGTIVEVNEAAVQMYRRPREDLVGSKVSSLRADGDAAAAQRVIDATDRGGISWEALQVRGDGTTFHAEVSARGEDVGGERMVVGTVRDATERILAGRALQEREALFRAIVENQSDVIFMMDATGRVTYASPSSLAVSGFAPEQLVGTLGSDFVHPDDRPRLAEAVGALVRPGGAGRVLLRVRHADGGWRHVEATVRDLLDAPGVEAFVVTSRDVTMQVELEARARRARQALVTLSRCNEAIARATTEDALLHATCRIIVEEGGYRMAWVGALVPDARRSVHPVAWAGHEDGYLATADVTWAEDDPRGGGPTGIAARTGEPAVGEDLARDPRSRPWSAEALRRGYRSSVAIPLHADGRLFGVLTLYAGDPDAFAADELAFLRQLAEDLGFGVGALRARVERAAAEERLRRSREELRALAGRLDAVREEEKARIARDLHDDMGQILTGLRIDLDHLEEKVGELPPGPIAGDLMDRAVDASALVSKAIAAMRNALAQLRPAALDRLGLAAALRQECREFEARTGVRCALAVPDALPVPADAETALFRIAQEALTNVARHARASRVRIALERDGVAIVLSVADDGRGPNRELALRGLGIVGMRERAERLGGELTVVGGHPVGTVVTARIPSPHDVVGGTP